MSMPAGRPTELDDDLLLKMREGIIQGKTMKEMAELSGIPLDTVQGWISRNYNGFSDKMKLWKMERRLAKAEENIDEVLEMDTINKEVIKLGYGEDATYDAEDFQDPRLIKIKADVSTFVAETLGRSFYSKRNELTGKDGKDLLSVKDALLQLHEQQREAIDTETV